ncbi:MAG: cell division protein ZapA [Cytophagaceae bacterium]|nr:cell division protein ZapA [Cytophagaceae bacterium]
MPLEPHRFNVRITIGYRWFQLKVPASREALVRQAAELIDERMRRYKDIPDMEERLSLLLLDTTLAEIKRQEEVMS